MSRPSTQKLIDKFKRGYTPVELTPKASLSSTYKNLFKTLVSKKDFNLFFELFDTNEVVLRAWSILGLHHILEETSIYQEARIEKIQNMILETLRDEREIKYYGGSTELQTPLREHHVRRICEIDPKISYKPAREYCQSFENVTDSVVSDLIENLISKVDNSEIEPLILRLAENTSTRDFHLKTQMVRAFENLSQKNEIVKKNEITRLFKSYLATIKETKITDQDFLKNVKSLQENIFRVSAVLGLELEEDTLEFIDSLKYPYSSLDLIAQRYKMNEKFVSIVLKKLNESNNPNFIADLLRAILVMRDNIDGWQDLIIKKVKEFQIVDSNLISDMQESEIINQDLILKLLTEGNEWAFEFIREFFIENPEILQKWSEVKEAFIQILRLNLENSDDVKALLNKKELIFKLIIDLEEKELVNYCLANFKMLNNSNLKKLAVFPILKFGEEKLLLELKNNMKEDANMATFVLNFIESLDRNEWKFFY